MRNSVLLALFLGFAACTPSGNGSDTPDAGDAMDGATVGDAEAGDTGADSGPVAITYHSHIRAFVEQNCIECHDPGGIGPFELDTFDKLTAVGALADNAIQSGVMPPWVADPACHDLKDARLLTQEQKEMFASWVANGMPEGNPDDYVEPDDQLEALPEPDIHARPYGSFRPTVVGGDEYRCFLLDAEFAEDTFVTAINVDPGNRSLVHHSDMFLVNPTNAARVQELEDADEVAGYPCFGDPGVATVNLIGAWVPGMAPVRLPEDHAIRIPAGSRIVMQAHFNSLYAELDDVMQDFQMWTRDTPPAKTVRALPIADLSFEVPAGEKESIHVMNVRNLSDGPWNVMGAAAHLHLLATRVSLEVIRPGDAPDACLLHIPEWDFNWQQAYLYEDDAWELVNPGDVVRLTCVFDNSPENQPVINGTQQQPRDVGWGGETFDEMCLAFLIVAEDYDPSTLPSGELCDTFKTCRADCDDQFGVGCIFNCAATELDCGECLLLGAQRCAQRHCPDELIAASPCLLTCAQGAQAGGDIDGCLMTECPAERDAFEACIRPVIEGGLCNDDIRSCNVEL